MYARQKLVRKIRREEARVQRYVDKEPVENQLDIIMTKPRRPHHHTVSTKLAGAWMANNEEFDFTIQNTNKKRKTPLITIASKILNGTQLQWMVDRGANMEDRDEFGSTALMVAVKNRKLANVKYIVKHMKVNLEAKDRKGNTPLIIAAKLPDKSMAISLLEAGANPKVVLKQNKASILHLSVMKGSPDLATKLIEDYHMDVDIRDRDGNTPLHFCEEVEIATCLKKHKATWNATNNAGHTPLMTAGRRTKSASLVTYLIEQGADIEARDHRSRSAFQHATRSNMCANYSFKKPFFMAFLKALPKTGRGAYGDSPLHSVLRSYQFMTEYIQCIIEKGADVNALNDKMETPLDMTGCFDTLSSAQELLLDAGGTFSVNTPTVNKRFIRSFNLNNYQMICVLLKQGQHPNWNDTKMSYLHRTIQNFGNNEPL